MTTLSQLVIQDFNITMITPYNLQLVEEDISSTVVGLCIAMFGMLSNIFNSIIYWRIGFKDSMSIELFALSVTDFLTTFLYAVINVCYLVDKLYPTSPVDFWVLGYGVFGWTMNLVYMCSCWITAMISVERCVCVVYPFKVKQIFTRLRCTIAILTIYIIYITAHLPIFILNRWEWVEFPAQLQISNITELTVRVLTIKFTEERARTGLIFDITVSLTLSDLAFIILISCTYRMIHALKVSSNFRAVKTLHTLEPSFQKSGNNLSRRERKLVKVVLSLAITLSVCGLPRVFVITIYNIIPNLNIDQFFEFNKILWDIVYNFNVLGCSITIFLYLVLNSNYRSQFYQIIGYNK